MCPVKYSALYKKISILYKVEKKTIRKAWNE